MPVQGGWRMLLLALILAPVVVRAEPYLAVQTGYKCNICHVNPTGGGLRNNFGILFAKLLLPSDTSMGADGIWDGNVTNFLRVGGDVRADWQRNSVPHSPAEDAWSLNQARVYGDVELLPERLAVYVDELLAPGTPESQEAYVRYGSPTGWYLKGGKFYLPFGWRLQDQTAFVREATGISMSTPDNGVEFGYERGSWSLQFDWVNGAANAQSGRGHQFIAQAVYVTSRWRTGAAASFTQSDAGDRRMAGVFAGLRCGPVSWLGEIDWIRDDGFPGGARQLASGLVEADWLLHRGHNLKVTAESTDPDRAVREDQQTRYSLVYEYTPLPFLQLRGGFRAYKGIPQNDLQNRRLTFFELHGYF